MICQNCAAAGDLTRQPSALPGATWHLANNLHRDCTGCTCQHHTPGMNTLVARRAAQHTPGTGLASIPDNFADA